MQYMSLGFCSVVKCFRLRSLSTLYVERFMEQTERMIDTCILYICKHMNVISRIKRDVRLLYRIVVCLFTRMDMHIYI